jgi:hypothetical protein
MEYIVVCLAALVVSALTLFSGFGLGSLLMPGGRSFEFVKGIRCPALSLRPMNVESSFHESAALPVRNFT